MATHVHVHIHTRDATAHDPHNGQFTSSGAGSAAYHHANEMATKHATRLNYHWGKYGGKSAGTPAGRKHYEAGVEHQAAGTHFINARSHYSAGNTEEGNYHSSLGHQQAKVAWAKSEEARKASAK